VVYQNGAGPAPSDRCEAGIDLGAGKYRLSSRPQANVQAIRADLTGTNTCTAAGVTARASAPVLALCRELLAAGVDPDRAMQVYRRATLSLHIRSIGVAAGLEINGDGTGFRPSRKPDAAPPMRQNGNGGAT
jgi:hypothetical protein